MNTKMLPVFFLCSVLSFCPKLFAQGNIADEMYAPSREMKFSLKLAMGGPEVIEGLYEKETARIVTVTTKDLIPVGYKYYLCGYGWNARLVIAGPQGQVFYETSLMMGMYDVESSTEHVNTWAERWQSCYLADVSLPRYSPEMQGFEEFLRLNVLVLDKGILSAVFMNSEMQQAQTLTLDQSALAVMGEGEIMRPQSFEDPVQEIIVLSGKMSAQFSNFEVMPMYY